MFKKVIMLIGLLSLLSFNAAQAATTFQLDPPNGVLSGLPGSTVGWGFTLSNTENFLVVTSAAFEPATDLGTFMDFISAPDNFFVVGPAPGASNVWAQAFNAVTQTGIGSFAIDPNAALGGVAYGEIVLTYDLFALSPLNPNFNPDTDTLSNGNILTASASVVTAVVPLPGAVWLFGSAVVSILGFCKRQRCI
jgi:hypothetical protein